MAELLGRRRPARIAFPRMVGMYLCRERTSCRLVDIGDAFNRHHTAVIHGHKTIDELLEIYPELNNSITYLEGKVSPDGCIPPAFLPYCNN